MDLPAKPLEVPAMVQEKPGTSSAHDDVLQVRDGLTKSQSPRLAAQTRNGQTDRALSHIGVYEDNSNDKVKSPLIVGKIGAGDVPVGMPLASLQTHREGMGCTAGSGPTWAERFDYMEIRQATAAAQSGDGRKASASADDSDSDAHRTAEARPATCATAFKRGPQLGLALDVGSVAAPDALRAGAVSPSKRSMREGTRSAVVSPTGRSPRGKPKLDLPAFLDALVDAKLLR